jgi:2-polyprenyl-3-methyl-5-hydroxy-6-metoxy-1,4-benzoquinol methylase
MNRPATKQLVSFLRDQQVDSGFMNRLKVAYRPYICPFDDLLKLIDDKDTVFDIGCGSGQFATLLAEFTGVKKIGGVEISPELIKNARHLLQPYSGKVACNFSVYDGTDIPDLSGYSVIVLIDVLHHVPPASQHNFLKTIYANMKAGTRLIIKDIEGASSLVLFNKLHDRIFAGEVGNEMKSAELKSILENLGFSVKSVSRKNMYVYPHYTLLATK